MHKMAQGSKHKAVSSLTDKMNAREIIKPAATDVTSDVLKNKRCVRVHAANNLSKCTQTNVTFWKRGNNHRRQNNID